MLCWKCRSPSSSLCRLQFLPNVVRAKGPNQFLNSPYTRTTIPVCRQMKQHQPQQTLLFLLMTEPSVEEVYAAIKRLRNGHVPGPDGTPPELLKCASRSCSTFHLLSVWRTGKCPLIGRTELLSLYKGKGPKSECYN